MGRRKARPSPYTPPIVKEEDVLLYKSASEAEAIKKETDFTPEQQKRLDKMSAKEEAKKDRYAKKLTTRADVMGMIALWQDSILLPMASRLDQVEKYIEYLETPLYKKLYIGLMRMGARIKGFAGRIKIVKLKRGDGDGGEASRDGEPGTEG